MRKLTPLMDELMRWFGARLVSKTPNQRFGNVRISTWTGLIDRGLITPYAYPVTNKHGRLVPGGHALTTNGLAWLLTYVSDMDVRIAVKSQLIRDAAHCFALAELEANASGKSYALYAESRAAEAAIGAGFPFKIYQGPRPKGAEVCGISSAPDGQSGVIGSPCTRSRHTPLVDGNHSWAPDDLAPCSTKEQREALAADRMHVEKTSTPDVFDTYGADRRWTYLGGSKFRLGPDTDPVVTAHAVRDVHGWFMLHILGHVFGPVARGEDGMWREVNK